jgi:hypothetical protein
MGIHLEIFVTEKIGTIGLVLLYFFQRKVFAVFSISTPYLNALEEFVLL